MIVKSSATLRISSDSLRSSKITEILGVAPDSSFEKGDLISTKSPRQSFRKAAMWQWSSKLNEEESLNKHLDTVCQLLKEKEEIIPSLEGCQIDIFCGVFSDSEQIGFDIDHEIIRSLAKYPVHLTFDVYGKYTD